MGRGAEPSVVRSGEPARDQTRQNLSEIVRVWYRVVVVVSRRQDPTHGCSPLPGERDEDPGVVVLPRVGAGHSTTVRTLARICRRPVWRLAGCDSSSAGRDQSSGGPEAGGLGYRRGRRRISVCDCEIPLRTVDEVGDQHRFLALAAERHKPAPDQLVSSSASDSSPVNLSTGSGAAQGGQRPGPLRTQGRYAIGAVVRDAHARPRAAPD